MMTPDLLKILAYVCRPEGRLSKPTIFAGQDIKKIEEAVRVWKGRHPIGTIEQATIEIVE
jgi:hypothetical protein